MDFLELQNKIICIEKDFNETSEYLIKLFNDSKENSKIIFRQIFLIGSKRVLLADKFVEIIKILKESYKNDEEFENLLLVLIFDRIFSEAQSIFYSFFLRKLIISSVIPADKFFNMYKTQHFDPNYITKNEYFLISYCSLFIREFDNDLFNKKLGLAMSEYQDDEMLLIIKEYKDDYINEVLEYGDIKQSLWSSIKYDNISNLSTLWSYDDFSFDNKVRCVLDPIEGCFSHRKGFELLEAASLFGAEKCFKFLLLNGVKPTEQTMEFAVCGGNIEIVKLIDRYDSSFNINCYRACEFFRSTLFDWIVKTRVKKVNVEEMLKYSAIYENFSIASLYCSRAQKITLCVEEAMKCGNIDFILFLIQKGISFDTNNAKIPLFVDSCKYGTEMFKLMYSLPNIDVNFRNKLGETVLHTAIGQRNMDVIKILLNNDKVDVNAKAKSGETPLHWAAHMSDIEIGTMLLKHPSIDPNIIAKNYFTPFDIAKKNHCIEFIEILRKSAKYDILLEEK